MKFWQVKNRGVNCHQWSGADFIKT
jgi:hypothetical protein